MHSIRICKSDLTALKDSIGENKTSKDKRLQKNIAALNRALNSAEVFDEGDVELIDAVALNTSVRFKELSTGEDREFLLVRPKLEFKELGRLSILSDIGISLLGRKKGEVVQVRKDSGKQCLIQIIAINPVNLYWIRTLEERI